MSINKNLKTFSKIFWYQSVTWLKSSNVQKAFYILPFVFTIGAIFTMFVVEGFQWARQRATQPTFISACAERQERVQSRPNHLGCP